MFIPRSSAVPAKSPMFIRKSTADAGMGGVLNEPRLTQALALR